MRLTSQHWKVPRRLEEDKKALTVMFFFLNRLVQKQDNEGQQVDSVYHDG